MSNAETKHPRPDVMPRDAAGTTNPATGAANEAAARPSRLPSVRVVVTWVVVVPLVLTSAVLLALGTAAGERGAESLVGTLMDSVSSNVQKEVSDYLAVAARLSDVYAGQLHDGRLPTTGLQAWEPVMADDLARTPGVASICFASTDGETTWLLRGRKGLEVGRVRGGAVEPGATNAVEFPVTARGAIDGPAIRTYTYLAHERPWYKAGLASDAPTWTPVYAWYADDVNEASIGIGYTRAIKDNAGATRGVLVIDITLGALGRFLRQLPVAQVGRVFIADGEGRLIAASEGSISAGGERMLLSQCSDRGANAAARVLAAHPNGAGSRTARDDAGGSPVRLRIAQVSPQPGIEWNVITVLPESAFLAEVQSGQRRATILASAAVAGGALIGLVLGRRLSRPVKELSSHVDRVGAGAFEQRLELGTAREFRELAEHVNAMAAGLKERMQLQQSLTLAREVQQALLPREQPRLEGLDITGRTHYCDDTGGDYFDFVTTPGEGGAAARTILVLGDVMGHGIAAALLMATARAALRAYATPTASLGEVMTRVNALLAASVRDGSFMTMSLLRVDPTTREARWASAGHDAVIVYEPGPDRFSELADGDVPLGLIEDTTYEEYRREGLDASALLCIGTDGIWEMPNAAGELFGKDRFREVLRKNAMKPTREIADALEAALKEHQGRAAQTDDVTFVIVRLGAVAGE